ncbi:hypothetical protein ACKUT9_22900 [Mycobacterium seoulense]|uniref:hypothetical protein n=1 Tax=Mycobacterium seoulense TaxID=386911 RepID=UPI003CF9CC8F
MTIAPMPTSAVDFHPEPRMFIDRRLRDASSGQVFDNINPATEEILGVAADASHRPTVPRRWSPTIPSCSR